MRQRLAIAISSLVAAAVLAVGLTAAGFGPEPRPATAEEPPSAAIEGAVEDVEREVIYVEPAPKPETVVVKKRVQQRSGSTAAGSTTRGSASRSDDDDDDEAEDRHEHRRESAKERREERREDAKERREHEDEDDEEHDD
ncbi:MAG: hypothetical protein AB1Z67_08905 [Candidatus Limnocylindrales bacterium]